MLIAVEMKSVMNKVSAEYVWRFMTIISLAASVLHAHNDLIGIQKLIIMHTHLHTHTHTHRAAVVTESQALGLAVLLHSDR